MVLFPRSPSKTHVGFHWLQLGNMFFSLNQSLCHRGGMDDWLRSNRAYSLN